MSLTMSNKHMVRWLRVMPISKIHTNQRPCAEISIHFGMAELEIDNMVSEEELMETIVRIPYGAHLRIEIFPHPPNESDCWLFVKRKTEALEWYQVPYKEAGYVIPSSRNEAEDARKELFGKLSSDQRLLETMLKIGWF